MDVDGGKFIQLTTALGRSDAHFSPDNSNIALLYSTATRPWELYLMDNKENAIIKKNDLPQKIQIFVLF